MLASGRTSEDDVEDILNRVGDEVTTTTSKTSTLEDVDDVVPVERVSIVPFDLTAKVTYIIMFIPES